MLAVAAALFCIAMLIAAAGVNSPPAPEQIQSGAKDEVMKQGNAWGTFIVLAIVGVLCAIMLMGG